MRSLLLPIALTALTALPMSPGLAEITGVVVVRHAEKAADGSSDPALTLEGEARARALAEALSGSEVGALLASQYQRTQLTLAPLAERHALDIETIEATSGDIDTHVDAIAARVRQISVDGLVVIAGHSNTVPLIVEALSGQTVAPMPESEYDRLHLLLPGTPEMDVVTSRFGAE